MKEYLIAIAISLCAGVFLGLLLVSLCKVSKDEDIQTCAECRLPEDLDDICRECIKTRRESMRLKEK